MLGCLLERGLVVRLFRESAFEVTKGSLHAKHDLYE